jgi:hypothetical protein
MIPPSNFPSAANPSVAVKVHYRNVIRRIRVPLETSLEQFLQQCSNLFADNIRINTHFVTYIDDEKDQVTLETNEEWSEAFRVASKLKCLKVNIHERKKSKLFADHSSSTPGHASNESSSNDVITHMKQVLIDGALSVFNGLASGGKNNGSELPPASLQSQTKQESPVIRHLPCTPVNNNNSNPLASHKPPPNAPFNVALEPVKVEQIKLEQEPVKVQPLCTVKVESIYPPNGINPFNPDAAAIPSEMEQSWTFIEMTPNNTSSTLSASFIRDITFPDRSKVIAGSTFVKVWSIKNSGLSAWPEGTTLTCIDPSQCDIKSVTVPLAKPGEIVPISVTVKAPEQPGNFRSYFKLKTSKGEIFGNTFWLEVDIISVKRTDDILLDSKWAMQLKLLKDMGITGADILIPILEKNNGDIAKTVQEYLEKESQ